MKFRDLINGRPPLGEVVAARSVRELPSRKLQTFSKEPVSAFCAPPGCMKDVHQRVKKRMEMESGSYILPDTVIKNVKDWNQRKDFADGLATSLYEKSTANDEKKLIGDPVADSLAIVTRLDSCILALADGVSWGHKSKLAATCSIYSSVTHLNEYLQGCRTTREVFRCIMKGFEKAQDCIVSEQATMTTLCVAVVVPLQEKDRWALCVVNVGDSYAYVYNPKNGVKEVTEHSHPIDEIRDMRQSGGALGPADGYNPDLGNLTCSLMILEEGDLVFLCSDGVSDNFDPAVTKLTPQPRGRQMSMNGDEINPQYNRDSSFEEIENANIIGDGNNRIVSANNERKEVSRDEDVLSPRDDDANNSNHQQQRNLPTIVTDNPSAEGGSYYVVGGNEELCENCLNAQSTENSLDISNQSRRKIEIKDLFPHISDTQTVHPQFHCERCDDIIGLKLFNADRISVSEHFPRIPCKISNSASLDQIRDSANSTELNDQQSRFKSSSFNYISNKTKGVEHNKEVAVSMLKQASSVAKLNSYPSVDFITGLKHKKQNLSDLPLTCRDRRSGALQLMTEVIRSVEPAEDGYNVGEVCAQIVSFVMRNTDQKRKILEKVPYSELMNWTSKERKEHNENIKKQLEGIPGKLDHASIVCYEVGIHVNQNLLKLDRQKSTPAAGNNIAKLSNGKHGDVQETSFNAMGNKCDDYGMPAMAADGKGYLLMNIPRH